MELFIIFGGAYALYTVGMAIASELDYREANKKMKIKLEAIRNFSPIQNGWLLKKQEIIRTTEREQKN